MTQVAAYKALTVTFIDDEISVFQTIMAKLYKEQHVPGFKNRVLTEDELEAFSDFVEKLSDQYVIENGYGSNT